MTFAGHFGRCRYRRLLFGAASAADLFQRKIDKMLYVSGIVNDISILGYDKDGEDHDTPLCRIFQICRKENLKLSKDNCHF